MEQEPRGDQSDSDSPETARSLDTALLLLNWLAGIGLVLGFLGALLMFRFGVPSYPERSRA